jgi:hypothetical protein
MRSSWRTLQRPLSTGGKGLLAGITATCYPACSHGQCLTFRSVPRCVCEDGWTGDTCQHAVCERGCVHGECDWPDHCSCKHPMWHGPQCSVRCDHGRYLSIEVRMQLRVCSPVPRPPSTIDAHVRGLGHAGEMRLRRRLGGR